MAVGAGVAVATTIKGVDVGAAVGTGVAVGAVVGTGVGLGVAVAHVQVESPVHDVFRQNPAEQLIPEIQSESVLHELLH